MTEAYPLHWPPHRTRTRFRDSARFKTTFAVARDTLMRELERLGAKHVVLSTNISLRNDGLPYAGQREPDDPGVAVYFQYKGKAMCFACDRWAKVHDNMQAVRHTIEALRGIARWGTGDMLEAAFSGFAALPPPSSEKQWAGVLGVHPEAPLSVIEESYKRLARAHHPDVGGSAERMAELNAAIEQVRKEKA